MPSPFDRIANGFDDALKGSDGGDRAPASMPSTCVHCGKSSDEPVAVGSAQDTRLDPDKRKAVAASLANAFK